LDRIYREQRRQLFACALAVTRCPERAGDAIQEAFYRLFRLERRPRHLKAYVFRTVRNAAVSQLQRRPPPARELDDSIFDPTAGPDEEAEATEFREQVARALAQLSDDERETIIMRLYGELKFREIARVREARPGSVAAWYRRGMKKLRTLLEEEE
jgi:RNA polymerase sigma-70 factor (ECF subfamily)